MQYNEEVDELIIFSIMNYSPIYEMPQSIVSYTALLNIISFQLILQYHVMVRTDLVSVSRYWPVFEYLKTT